MVGGCVPRWIVTKSSSLGKIALPLSRHPCIGTQGQRGSVYCSGSSMVELSLHLLGRHLSIPGSNLYYRILLPGDRRSCHVYDTVTTTQGLSNLGFFSYHHPRRHESLWGSLDESLTHERKRLYTPRHPHL